MNGVVVVDKPAGCTSHDVVQRVRRALKQKAVGHAGTLDPLATGVLVILLGEATKLASYLQADDKDYEVTIALGAETDSLDGDGEVVETAPVGALDRDKVAAALQEFIGQHPQRVPDLSAVKSAGKPLHRRVRKGESVEAPVREVVLHQAEVLDVAPDAIMLSLRCGKGFYVRSLARDLARALGTRGHVNKLRRTRSGAFFLAGAVDGDALSPEAIEAGLVPLEQACGSLRRVVLTVEGVEDARHGRAVLAERVEGAIEPGEDTLALMAPDGSLVALGRVEGEAVRVVRGFR